MTPESVIWLIPLPPLLAFFLIVLFTNRSKAFSHILAIGAAVLSWAGSLWIIWQALQVEHFGEHPFEDSINWIPTGSSFLKIGVLVDPLTAVTLFFVAWTVLMIVIYSVGGPVFYTQERVGKDEKLFKVFKFRSMREGRSRLPARSGRTGKIRGSHGSAGSCGGYGSTRSRSSSTCWTGT